MKLVTERREPVIFFTSDLHFCHDKDFIWRPRGFFGAEAMTRELVENYNLIVAPDDEVYILGDCIMSDMERGLYYMRKLNGKIHIICGNHDTPAKIAAYKKLPQVVEICDAKYLDIGKFHFYLSHFPTIADTHQKPLKKTRISLCGHTHTPDKWSDWDKAPIYHVEVDAHMNFPVSIEKIISELKEKREE